MMDLVARLARLSGNRAALHLEQTAPRSLRPSNRSRLRQPRPHKPPPPCGGGIVRPRMWAAASAAKQRAALAQRPALLPQSLLSSEALPTLPATAKHRPPLH